MGDADVFLARKDKAGHVQTLYDHLHNSGDLAAGFESRDEAISRTAGLHHDVGKLMQDFQDYLLTGNKRRGEVVHARQGAFVVDDCPTSRPYDRIAKEVLELAIVNHHGSLPDCINESDWSSFFDKMAEECKQEDRFHYQEVLSHVSELDLDTEKDLLASGDDVAAFRRRIINCRSDSRRLGERSQHFYMGLYAKYIYSRLVDADRVDAAHFESGQPYTPNSANWEDLIQRLEGHLDELDTLEEINRIRARISVDCLNASDRETGIYRLGVPTGGGKALASLRFALHHAAKTGKSHIIYVIPYLSITSQTVEVFRHFLDLQDDDSQILLEHYSSVVRERSDDEEKDGERKNDDDREDRRRLAAERWDNPIIVTTMVQFLETVMSARASKLRKFHNMADSVIIFDEIQALPVNTINLFNEIVSFLSKILNSTILLCSATQPLLDRTDRKNLLLSDKPDLIDRSSDYAQRLRRTNIVASSREISIEDLAPIIFEKAQSNGNCLAIVNLRSEARILYQRVRDLNETLDPERRFMVMHLSTSMCGQHRKDRLSELLSPPDKKKPRDEVKRVICISTQLIEAGVDVSFTCVIRAMAGLDSILQAAGRCNRNGESKTPKDVYVYPIAQETGLNKIPDIKLGKEITRQLIHLYPDADLMSEQMIGEYYQFYLDSQSRNQAGVMDYRIPGRRDTAYDLLSANMRGRESFKQFRKIDYSHTFAQAFRTVSDSFHVIAGGAMDVVVPYKQAMKLVDDLKKEDLPDQIRTLRLLQDYSVSLYDYEVRKLNESGLISPCNDEFGIQVLNEANYDPEYGVVLDAEMPFLAM